MQIKVLRGANTIGGSIVEITTAKARIIIDMGTELPSANKEDDDNFDIDGVTVGTPNCDAVLITHYHGDHVGMFEKVLPQVPIYMGEVAKKIYTTLQNTLKKKLDKGNPELVERFKTFAPGKSFQIKDINVTPLTVDHSAFDAYAFLIEADGKRVLHTGDFRMHGARGRKMPELFEKYAGNLDVLITEGTMLSRTSEKVLTQHEMGRQAEELVANHKNVFVLCSSTNIDSIANFYNAAIKAKKPFVVCEDDFQGEILRIITKNSRSPFYNFDRQKVYTYGKSEKFQAMLQDRGFVMMSRVNWATEQAMRAFPDSLLIYSMWVGYLDKNRPAFDERTYNFVERAKSAGARFEYLHTSGHATAEDIVKLVEITKPRFVIPIHTENAESLQGLVDTPVVFNELEV